MKSIRNDLPRELKPERFTFGHALMGVAALIVTGAVVTLRRRSRGKWDSTRTKEKVVGA